MSFKKFVISAIVMLFVFKSFTQDAKQEEVIFDENTYNLREVAINQEHTATFIFTNKTSKSIALSPILREADIKFNYPKKEISPNESIAIKAVYHATELGLFARQFSVSFHEIEQATTLTITGIVIPEKEEKTVFLSYHKSKEEKILEYNNTIVPKIDIVEDTPFDKTIEEIKEMEQSLADLKAKHNRLTQILKTDDENKVVGQTMPSSQTTPCNTEQIKSMELLATELEFKYLTLETALLKSGVIDKPIKIEPEPEKPKVTDLVIPKLSTEDYAANNILFLIDISTSMGRDNKIDLLKKSIKNLALVLRDIDKVSIITYNQKNAIALESISGDNTQAIHLAIDSLRTSGLTYGVSGIQRGYEVLENQYIRHGNNQIILATDGLFSAVNATMTENELNRLVRGKANNEDIILSVIGFGKNEAGLKLMDRLAKNGKGQFIQINNESETEHTLIEEIKGNSQK